MPALFTTIRRIVRKIFYLRIIFASPPFSHYPKRVQKESQTNKEITTGNKVFIKTASFNGKNPTKLYKLH